jgi:type I restriction enzyme S subunit
MVKMTKTSYECKLCKYECDQKSHIKEHLSKEKHLKNREIEQLKLEKLSKKELLEKFETDDIEEILKKFEKIKHVEEKEMEEEIYISPTREWEDITNSEALREKIHEIHNFLRNKGAGYGMNALKTFNIFYGLKKIEDEGVFKKTGLGEECKFSSLLKLAKKGDYKSDDIIATIISKDIMKAIYNNKKMKPYLFYIVPDLEPKIYSELIIKISTISDVEQKSGEQLSGKIYEYFIGRDASAISELGAYFTNRKIVNFIYEQINIELDENGEIPEMIDMFGGSGGFTIGYINYIKNKYKEIDLKKNIDKIYHYDMNEDVIKSAGLEFFCLTKEFPKDTNLSYKNSFVNEFGDKKFKYVITNPPYGGDKNKETSQQIKRKKIKEYIENNLKNNTVEDEDIDNLKTQLLAIKKDEKAEKLKNQNQKVSLQTSSKRIKNFAKKYNLKANDKEAVSFIQIMEMLDKGGTACAVLKEGVFFNSVYKDIRKVLVENYNLKKIISIASNQFENTATKTSIIIFENTGPTKKVEFYDLLFDSVEEDEFEIIDDKVVLIKNKGDIINVYSSLISSATNKEISENDIFSLNSKDYNKEFIKPGDGYELVKLGDICELKNGKQLNTKNIIKGIYPVYGGGSSILGFHNNFNNDKCTVISGTGSCGLVQFCNNKFWASQAFTIKSKDILINKYLFIICKSFEYIFKESQNGSAQKYIRASNFKDLQLPIPKSKEKIKEWTDKISLQYNNKNDCYEKIKELENIVKERILEIEEKEECEEIELENICEINPEILKNNQFNQISYIDIGSVKEEKINNIKILTENFPSRAKRIIKKDDILFSTVRPNLKGYTLINYNIENGVASSGFAVIRSYKINPKYIYTILKEDKIIEYLMLNSTGTKYPAVNPDFFKKIKIKIPKNEKLIDDMKPLFKEIENFQKLEKIASDNFDKLIEELGKESIKN